MVIDANMHPHFIKEICEDEKRVSFRKEKTGIFKPRIIPLDFLFERMKFAGIDKGIFHAMDITTKGGDTIVSNEEIATLLKLRPDDFYGLGSVDPHRKDALDVVEKAFKDLKLHGLVLDPSLQEFYPNDEKLLYPIYQLCQKYNKPVYLKMGISLEPKTRSKYSRPFYLDDVMTDFPDLRVAITGFSWPWVQEAATLMLKHQNLYSDTALLYFDSAEEFYNWVLKKQLGPLWIDRSLCQQVMFGTLSGHFNQIRQADAMSKLDLRDGTKKDVLSTNALRFLGIEQRRDRG